MVDALKKQAEEELRSLTGQIRLILGRHLKLTAEETAADDSEETKTDEQP